jgi:hypothetical protein
LAAVYLALLHYPVLDKDGRVINTAVTNLDLHDLARLARTYGLRGYYVAQPLALQRKLVERLLAYWRTEGAGEYNRTRQEAFEALRLVNDLDEAVAGIEAETGSRPTIVGTSARQRPGAVSFPELRDRMAAGGCWLIVFGTGWGIEPGFMAERADELLEPIDPGAGYNHLSVRAAAAIVIDRLLGRP